MMCSEQHPMAHRLLGENLHIWYGNGQSTGYPIRYQPWCSMTYERRYLNSYLKMVPE